MLFSTVIFIFCFLPFVLVTHTVLYFHAQKNKKVTPFLNLFLLLASLIFYAWGEAAYLLILLFCTFFTFHTGLFIEKQGTKKSLWIGILGNLLLLVYFKYAMLFIAPYTDFFNQLLPKSLAFKKALNIALPLGISFYVFQAISYLVDIYRKKMKACRNIIDFSCYLTMFPQLIAGPIVRYVQIKKELCQRNFSVQNFSNGASRFILGLAKKILIADTLGRVADAAFAVPQGELSTYGAWIGIICYTFQIYYDFSGYSDMAIGIGKMLGFTFPENFNYPYIARSIQNFWQRWHMSLSLWFKDYLYIPLGGNRCKPYRVYFNLLIVFALCGFWHGASWTFMVWGFYYGLFLVLERIFPNLITRLPVVLQHFYVCLVVMMGWILFRAENFPHALSYYKALVGSFEESTAMNAVWLVWYSHDVTIALLCAFLFSTPVYQKILMFFQKKESAGPVATAGEIVHKLLLLAVFLVTLMPLFGATYQSFIYFRF